MILLFKCVGYKKDGRNKTYIWGILDYRYFGYARTYIVWGNSSRAYKKEIYNCYSYDLTSKKMRKMRENYKFISDEDIKNKCPEFIKDIEMQFMVDILTQ